MISTLFGLESFIDFVRNFTGDIDDRYLDLTGKKAALLAQKRQAHSGADQQLKTNTADLQTIATEEQQLANQYRDGATFSQMTLELYGREDSPNAIQRLESELQQPIPEKSNLTGAALKALRNSIGRSITDLRSKQQALNVASQQVSFRQLYEAISQVQHSSPELSQVAVNPFTHAAANEPPRFYRRQFCLSQATLLDPVS